MHGYRKVSEIEWLNESADSGKPSTCKADDIAVFLLSKTDIVSFPDSFLPAADSCHVIKSRANKPRKNHKRTGSTKTKEKYPVTSLKTAGKNTAGLKTPPVETRVYVPVVSGQADDKTTRRKDRKNERVRDEAMRARNNALSLKAETSREKQEETAAALSKPKASPKPEVSLTKVFPAIAVRPLTLRVKPAANPQKNDRMPGGSAPYSSPVRKSPPLKIS